MHLTKWLKSTSLIGAVALAPALSAAVRVESCVATPESHGNPARTASRLLKDIQQDATWVEYHSNKLRNFAMDQRIDWQLHIDQLARIQGRVNQMGRRLCRLEGMQDSVAPWQREAIQQTAPLVQEIADNTNSATGFVMRHQEAGDYWQPAYRTDARNLYSEAQSLARTIRYDRKMREELVSSGVTLSASGRNRGLATAQ